MLVVSDHRNRNMRGSSSKLIESSLCFVQSITDFNLEYPSTTIYVNTSHIVPPVTASTAIGVGLCKIVGLPPSFASALSLLLDAPTQELIPRILSDLHVGTNAVSVREAVRGHPGVEITDADKAMLELKPFRAYRTGEVVAYVDKNRNDKIYYARVLTVQESDAGLKKITLRTRDGIEHFLPTDIYSFRSAREINKVASAMPVKQQQKGILSSAFGSSLMASQSQNTKSNDTNVQSSVQNNIPSIPLSPVSHNDIIVALDGLLNRAGIPVSLETKVSKYRITSISISILMKHSYRNSCLVFSILSQRIEN
jgi:hypothetical protein